MQNIYDYQKFSYNMFILYFYFQQAYISDLELFNVQIKISLRVNAFDYDKHIS